MYRLSYRDLKWSKVFLQPERYTLKNGIRVPMGSRTDTDEFVRVDPDMKTACISMPAGQGKITDSGYDQMVCLAAEIPICENVKFSAIIHVLDYPSKESRNGQEGLGLFFRDTMEPDMQTGYPYSNMAAAGIIHGSPCIFGRMGITGYDASQILNFTSKDGSGLNEPLEDITLKIVLEKNRSGIRAEITEESSGSVLEYEAETDERIFTSRDPERMYLGFMAARGCRLEADLNSVSIEYTSDPGSSGTFPSLYVTPEGDSDGKGTADHPLDIQTAIDKCMPGQEIIVKPGLYRFSTDLVIRRNDSQSAAGNKKILIDKSAGVWAVLDFGGSSHGFRIEDDGWDISGMAVVKGFGFMISGSRNFIHDCRAAANLETGFLIRHPQNDSSKKEWPSDNEIADCISYLNRDISEQHADGFACKVAAGPGNRFIRCTAWMNSDDGFDLFSKNRATGAVTLEDCRSWLNGYVFENGKLRNTRGNGNGFKLGGSGQPVDHKAIRCEAKGNRGFGFTSNSNPRFILDGCRAGNNKENYFYYFTGQNAQSVYVFNDCTENDDGKFDPDAWAKELDALMSGDVAESLCNISIKQYNDGLIREAVSRAADLYGEEKDDRRSVLIMCSSLYGGGAERVACRLACGLSGKYRVAMIFIQDKGQTYPLDPEIKVIKIPVFRGSWEASMEGRIEFTRQIKDLLNVDISVSFMFTMNKINVRSGEKTKVICSERNNPAKRDPEHLSEIEGLYEQADHVVFQSETVRDLFSSKVREHHSIILNPVSVSCLRTRSRHRIVNVGRLVPQKNQAMLIRAFARFRKTHSDYTLSFYGIGELSEELEALARSLGIEEAVEFHGHVPDVHTAVSDAEIFALSSDYEGLSNALLECMMMGLPCISTRCEGSSDVIVSGKNGILTDIGSEAQMADALTMLADDAELRESLGKQARLDSEQYRAERILDRWERLIEEV